MLFIDGLGFMMDGSAKVEIEWKYASYSLLIGVITCTTIIVNLLRPRKYEPLFVALLLICDTVLFFLISQSFIYAAKSFHRQYEIYALGTFATFILTTIGQIVLMLKKKQTVKK